MKDKRPINLDLRTIKFPPSAIASILHRISGIIIFLFIPFVLWILNLSLHSSDEFAKVQSVFALPAIKILVWIFLAELIYHLVAGIRHLLMDAHIGEDLRSGQISAKITIVISIILIILAGIWLW